MLNAYFLNTLSFDRKLCNGCLMCVNVCPHAVFVRNRKAVDLARPQFCMECGACRLNCPTGAIQVDAGVGCAAAIMWAALTGRKENTSCCGA